MSRKSKRRRMRQVQTGSQEMRPEAAEELEFLDDRSAGAPEIATSTAAADAPADADASAAQRIESVPALPGPRFVSGADSPVRSREGAPPKGARPASASAGAPAARTTQAAPAAASGPAPAAPPVPVTTLGEVLVATREARGLSLEEASARTRISAKMLSHLENDRFGEFAADAYARGFLRSYGSFLGIDPQMLLERYEALQGGQPKPAPEEIWEAAVEPVRPAPRRTGPSRRTVLLSAVAGGIALVAAATAWLAHEGLVTLRPAEGLQQIEDELRRAQEAPVPTGAPTVPVVTSPESTVADSTNGSLASAASEPQIKEDTAPDWLSPDATSPRRVRPDTQAVTDLLQETEPPPPPLPPPASITQPKPVALAVPEDTAPLSLTATALDSCVLRVQVDADALGARRYLFTRRGEMRSWTAEQGFRVVVHPASNLELRLNGRLVPVPADGSTLVLDRATLQPERRATTAPKRTGSLTPKRSRSTRRSTPPPAPAAGAAPSEPQHAPGPL